MTTFETIHQSSVMGKLTMFDRLIFKGHLTGLFPDGAMKRFLDQQQVLLREFGKYAQTASEAVTDHAKCVAGDAGRPYTYLQRAVTRGSGGTKEDMARAIAARDGIREGLIAIFSAVEPCSSFQVRKRPDGGGLHIVRCRRKCLFVYLYLLDREFGLMHVRVQTWFPFEIQVYINGREWMRRQLDARGITHTDYDNAILSVSHLPTAQALSERFAKKHWPRILDVFARRFNPLTEPIARAGFGSYYWVIDQCEVATDVLFKKRALLAAVMPSLFDHAIRAFSADDVMRFLGRRLMPTYQGEVTTDDKRRPEGRRVKHRIRGNSIKMYDKASALRIETTINRPCEFKILRTYETEDGLERRWVRMRKGVAAMPRYLKVATDANERYLEALANVQPNGEAVRTLDDLCRCHHTPSRDVARLEPFGKRDHDLFRAVLRGENTIVGFRNRDIREVLFPAPDLHPDVFKRQCARVSRAIARLRGHGLVAKVPNSRLYRITERGYRTMAAAIRVREQLFPDALQKTA
jgi:hypothetical protein